MAGLAAFLRAHRDEILAEWKERAQSVPDLRGLPEPVLLNNMPQILDELAECLDRGDHCHIGLDALPSTHALDRYKLGTDVRAIAAEYRILRQIILERLGTDDDLRLLHRAVDEMTGAAVDHFALERDRSREIFVGILGHDLRNPLNAITIGAQQLLADAGSARIATRILSSAARIERMARDLLDVTRGRFAGGIPIATGPVELRDLLRDVADEFREAFPDRRIRTEATGDVAGVWDWDRLAQLVSNLIGNSLEHGRDPVTVRALDAGDEVTIECHNAGSFDVQPISRVFDPFVSEGRRGLGLGLYIVREIARAHGGRAEVVSSEAEGTTFRVHLPRRGAEAR